MVLGIIMDLCEMCRRLLTVCEAQQIELERMHANEQALSSWRRETEHIRDMLRNIES